MRFFLLFSLIIFQKLQAQDYLFDNNCLSIATSKKYIKGNSKYLNTISHSTERWFVWDRITKDYIGLIKNEDLMADARERYEHYDHLNPPLSLATCDDSDSINECLAFRAYCTEQIAIHGIQDELKEWHVRVKDCSRDSYIKKYPEHCQRDMVKSLNYLYYHMNKIAKAHSYKDPNVKKYFDEATLTFKQYANDMDALLSRREHSIERAKSLLVQKQARQESFELLGECERLNNQEKYDVNGRAFATHIINGGSCAIENRDKVLPDSTKLSLKQQLDNINEKLLSSQMAKKLDVISLKKSSKALWALHLKYKEKSRDFKLHDAISLVCSGQEKPCQPEEIAVLNKSYDEFKPFIIGIKFQEEEGVKGNVDMLVNKSIKKINSICESAHEKYVQMEKEYHCHHDIINLDRYVDDLPGDLQFILKNTKDYHNMRTCRSIVDLKATNQRSLMNQTKEVSNKIFNDLLSTQFGHLMITDKFREKVGTLKGDWVYNRCFKSGGKALNEIEPIDVKIAINNLMSLNQKELNENRYYVSNPEKEFKRLKQYIKNNPLSITKLLEESPSRDYTLALCETIRKMNVKDYRMMWFDRGVMGVGVVAGVALSMTGVGSPAGAALLATVGGVATYEVSRYSYKIKEEKDNIIDIQMSAASFQHDIEIAISEIEKKNAEIKSYKRSRQLVVVLAAVDVLGAGGLRIVKSFMKTKPGLRSGKILGLTADSLTGKYLSKVSLDLSWKLEKFITGIPSELRKMLNELPHENLLELAVFYNKLDLDSAKLLKEILARSDDSAQLYALSLKLGSKVDELIEAGNLNQKAMALLIDDLGKIRLPDGTILKDIRYDKSLDLSVVAKTKDVGDVSLQNASKIGVNDFYSNRIKKFDKSLNKDKTLKNALQEKIKTDPEIVELKKYFSFLNEQKRSQLASVLMDSNEHFVDLKRNLKTTGCFKNQYQKKCMDVLENILDAKTKKVLKEHELYSKWMAKQPEDFRNLFDQTGLNGHDLALAQQKLIGVSTKPISNPQKAKSYIEYISSLSGRTKVDAYDDLRLILEGRRPKSISYLLYTKRQMIFDSYEKLYYSKNLTTNRSKMIKIAKSRGIKATPENIRKIAKDEAFKLRKDYAKQFNTCKAGGAGRVNGKNLSQFLKVNTQVALTTDIGFYFGFLALDSASNKDDDTKLNSNMDHHVKILGYELVTAHLFSKLPALIFSGEKSSFTSDMLKDYFLGAGIGYGNSKIYGKLFGIDDEESKKKINEIMTDPKKKESFEALQSYVDKRLASKEGKEVISRLQNSYGEIKKDFDNIDSFSSLNSEVPLEDIVDNEEAMELIEQSFYDMQYDKVSGGIPMSSIVNELTLGWADKSIENDVLYYNSTYNAFSSGKRVIMFDLVSSSLCMGKVSDAYTLMIIDKMISGAIYWGGRKLSVGDSSKLEE